MPIFIEHGTARRSLCDIFGTRQSSFRRTGGHCIIGLVFALYVLCDRRPLHMFICHFFSERELTSLYVVVRPSVVCLSVTFVHPT